MDDTELIAALKGEVQAWILAYQNLKREHDALVAANNPELDYTDWAHPAWWRCETYMADRICRMVTDWIEGRNYEGTHQEPFETLRAKIKVLVEQANGGISDETS